MSAKAEVSISCVSALCVLLCAGPGVRAQVSLYPPPAPRGAIQDSSNELSVAAGKTVLVDCRRPVSRVAVGLGDVAEATAISPTEVMVNGKTAGATSLIIWDDRGGRQFFNVTVRPGSTGLEGSLDAIRRELSAEIPGQQLRLSTENGVIFLRGTVKDLNSSARAVQIASTAGKVVNLLNVDVPASDPQILLKVRFASVDRSKAKQLGINLFSLGLGNTIGGLTTGQFSPPTITLPTPTNPVTATFSNELNMLAFFPGLKGGATIDALENDGVVEVLAEPNVMAIDGKEASFLAGGEYPYPVVQGGGAGTAATVTIEFKEYGVRLNFIPTVTPRGTIRLQVAPEVSALDFTNAIEISGFEVPAITTRKVKTEVELKDGDTLVLGGLLDNRETETFEKIPLIGDIPILGKFFQSKSTNKTNTELIVMVTPEVVAPIPAGGAKPELNYPTKFLPPNSSVAMNTPDAKTNANTLKPPPVSIPVEKLIYSMKPETPLVIEGATGRFGAASNANGASPGAGGGAGGPSAPQ